MQPSNEQGADGARDRPLGLIGGVVVRMLIGVVAAYQWLFSAWLGGRCRYLPSCSEYAIASLKKYGPLRGSLKATWRVMRCNPFGGQGYDPP